MPREIWKPGAAVRRLRMLLPCLVVLIAASAATAETASATNGALAWGSGASGELGNGTTVGALLPTTVNELPASVTQTASGGGFTLALLSNGKVEAWGANSSGQLGDGNTTSSSTPVAVSGLSEVASVAAAGAHALALRKNGTVWAWGNNETGQLGNGTTTKSTVPLEVEGLGEEAISIGAGSTHSLAVLKGGTVKDWGGNFYGQLGTGSTSGPEKCVRNEPELEEVEEWNCSLKPVAVSELNNVTAVAGGGDHSLALLSSGAVKAWGANGTGQLGQGSHVGPETCSYRLETKKIVEVFEEACSTLPVSVTELAEVSHIAAGNAFNLALVPGGEVKSWGANTAGQLGDGTTTERDAPVLVSGLSGATAVAAGASHSLALIGGGSAKAWGQNGSGELGNGTTVSSSTPVEVSDLSKAEGLSAGTNFSVSFGAAGPTTEKLTPTSGELAGGTTVEIKGANLTEVTEVLFGTAAATGIEEISSTTLKVKSPAGSKPGAVAVVVRTKHGVSIGGPKFTYTPPGNIQFGRCVKVALGTGKYLNSACTEEGTGSFEWHPGVVLTHFTATGGATTFETTGLTKLTCTAESASGEYEGTKLVTGVTLVFTGCALSGSKCTSAGAKEGEMVSKVLSGGLGWQEKVKDMVGLDLAGETETVLEASCGASSVDIRGSVIAPITVVNKMVTSFKLKWAATKGVQKPEHFEGESNDILEMSISGGAFKQTGLTLSSTQSNEESMEINTAI